MSAKENKTTKHDEEPKKKKKQINISHSKQYVKIREMHTKKVRVRQREQASGEKKNWMAFLMKLLRSQTKLFVKCVKLDHDINTATDTAQN